MSKGSLKPTALIFKSTVQAARAHIHWSHPQVKDTNATEAWCISLKKISWFITQN